LAQTGHGLAGKNAGGRGASHKTSQK
jgi:hypothetical protein